ncbi:MAG: putative General secretion pathway protein GspG [Parcubacteria group bacterium Athens1014_10]|nr:MAG: putative General secretion pathway protein GspG [Parcubacteria group bacterium Athens1014_10]TSD05433.1 MAG: putative General secretion pathway protein GspG [Parcubacteria group bacterium Athens0714_12]
MTKSNKKGFTLIELLIVIAIIGLISVLAVTALKNAKEKTRNAKRKYDLKQIHTALELYYDNRRTYPSEDWCDSSKGSCATACPCAGSDWNYAATRIAGSLRNDNLMQNLPKDPLNNTTYYYWYEPDCNQGTCVGQGCCYYEIGVSLEGSGSFRLQGGKNVTN